MRRFRVHALVAALVTLFIAVGVVAQAVPNAQTDMQIIWSAVWSDYVDPFFGGVDWHRVPDRIGPRLTAAATEAEAYHILAEMLDELGDPGTYLARRSPVEGRGFHGIGIALVPAESLNRWIEGGLYREGEVAVYRVIPDSPAAQAGVLVGDIIVSVDGWEAYGADTDAVVERIHNGEGPRVELVLKAPGDEERRIEVEFAQGELRPRARLGANGAIAVMRLDAMTLPVLTEGAFALRRLGKVDALLLDLRGVSEMNPVSGAVVASWFLDTDHFGSVETRSDLRLLQPPSGSVQLYDGPLVVLVDEFTRGAAEIAALLLAESGRATLYGSTTAGGYSVPMVVSLTGDFELVFSYGRYVSPGGRTLHDGSIEPDVFLPPGPLASVRAGRDVWQERVFAWLRGDAESAAE